MDTTNTEASRRWQQCQRELVAKTIGECAYEACFTPEWITGNQYSLSLDNQFTYRFTAKKTRWGWLLVEPSSIVCDHDTDISATRFIIEAKKALALTDIVLANFIEELQNTLYCTMVQKQRLSQYTANELIQLDDATLQTLLDGHPKLISNKGRLGWGAYELSRYAPESGKTVKLQLLAVKRFLCKAGYNAETDPWTILKTGMSTETRACIEDNLTCQGMTEADCYPVPVHPWQWQRFIKPQYQAWIMSGDILLVGELDDHYLPQQSIRTLTNQGRSGLQHMPTLDIKLPISVLNTSCYRGIPGKHIATGADLSAWMHKLATTDSLLRERQLIVQREVCGIHCNHPLQKSIKGAPYQYHEMLGVVWRESLSQYLVKGQRGILMATLMQSDNEGRALIAAYITASGLSTEDWISRLFAVVVIPLYHLMAKYGVGLVAHGQNISLVLENYCPVAASIKDFHGDLRLLDEELPEMATLPAEVKAALTRLPANYLVHDLITGHFVTTLRFISPLVESQCGLPEKDFYRLLKDSLQHYMNCYPNMVDRFQRFPLLSNKIEKVCVNRVRFRVGYEDNADRPVPELATPILNPLLMEDTL